MPADTAEQFMNVTQLREELERLERAGCGTWEIDVAPDPKGTDRSAFRSEAAFDARRIGVTRLIALGDGSVDFVLLVFAPGPTGAVNQSTAA